MGVASRSSARHRGTGASGAKRFGRGETSSGDPFLGLNLPAGTCSARQRRFGDPEDQRKAWRRIQTWRTTVFTRFGMSARRTGLAKQTVDLPTLGAKTSRTRMWTPAPDQSGPVHYTSHPAERGPPTETQPTLLLVSDWHHVDSPQVASAVADGEPALKSTPASGWLARCSPFSALVCGSGPPRAPCVRSVRVRRSLLSGTGLARSYKRRSLPSTSLSPSPSLLTTKKRISQA